MIQYRIATIILLITLGVSGIYINYLNHKEPLIITKVKVVNKIVEVAPKGVLLSVVLADLQKDLQSNYSFLSQNQRQEILNSIIKSSNEFNINPLVIYSLISVESSMRWWVVSPTRTVMGSDKKKHKSNAKGLMSVIWSIHGKALVDNNIIQKESELREINGNIRAGSFILSDMIKRYKGLNQGLRHYFGVSPYSKTYLRKIQRKIGSLVWFKMTPKVENIL